MTNPNKPGDGLDPKTENSKGSSASVDQGAKGYQFSDLSDNSTCEPPGNLDFILDVPLEVSIELGRTRMLINELIKLDRGSVIELSKPAGEAFEILANRRLIARGEVVVINEKYGVRLTEIISPKERIEKLK